MKCYFCDSENIRSIDNEPLYHPSKLEVENGVSRFDNDIYIIFTCDDCNKRQTKVFTIKPM